MIPGLCSCIFNEQIKGQVKGERNIQINGDFCFVVSLDKKETFFELIVDMAHFHLYFNDIGITLDSSRHCRAIIKEANFPWYTFIIYL